MQTVHEATELKEQPPRNLQPEATSDFDPCSNAKVPSPFYLYKHDSRPSLEGKSPHLAQVSTEVSNLDLEAGTVDMSPTVTQEKKDAQSKAAGRFRFGRRKQKCMTKPPTRGCGWLRKLPPRQRLMVKILIALVIIGVAVGVAVGISIRVNGGVWKNNNTSAPIGG